MVKRIPLYQESEQCEKIYGFLVQFLALQWYAGEAKKRDGIYLINWIAVRMVMFGYRLTLTHSKLLFPHHKWPTTYVEKASDKPVDLVRWGNSYCSCQTEKMLADSGSAS